MTFDDYKNRGEEIEMTRSLGKSLDDHFSTILAFQIQLKVMHWGTDSYAEHKAYDKTYKSIQEGMDTLVESYQGYNGRIDFGCSMDVISFSNVDQDSWLRSIFECLNSMRSEIEQSDLQNQIDELIASVSKLKYLLSLK